MGCGYRCCVRGMLHYIGYLVPLVNRVKSAVMNVVNTISAAFGGIGNAIAKANGRKLSKIAWLGIRVASLKLMQSLLGDSGNLLQQFGDFLIDFAQGIVDVTVDLFWGLVDLVNRAFWGIVQVP